MNTATQKSSSPRNPETNEVTDVYRRFYLAVVAFGENPASAEHQQALLDVQREVEEIEEAYQQGRKLTFEKRTGMPYEEIL